MSRLQELGFTALFALMLTGLTPAAFTTPVAFAAGGEQLGGGSDAFNFGQGEQDGVVAGPLADRSGMIFSQSWSTIDNLGPRWIRLQTSWGSVEPQQNDFRWNSLDGQFSQAASRGHRIVPVIKAQSSWATVAGTGGSLSGPPRDMRIAKHAQYGYSQDYYDFIYRLVDRYKDDLEYLVIENEMNADVMWLGTQPQYYRLLTTASMAAHAAAPHVKITDSGFASGTWGILVARELLEAGYPNRALVFYNNYYRNAGKNFDSVARLTHFLYSSDRQKVWDRVTGLYAAAGADLDALNMHYYEDPWLLATVLRWIKYRYTLSGNTMPEIFSNEGGIRRSDPNYDKVGPQNSADLIKQIVYAMSSRLEFYSWFPRDGDNNQVGFLNDNGSYRMAAHTYTFLNQQFATRGYDMIASIHTGTNLKRYRIFSVSNPLPVMEVLWWDDGGHRSGSMDVTVELPPGTSNVFKYDYYGSATALTGVANGISLTINQNPTIIECLP